VLAYAKIFMASAATSLSLAGVVIVGALGQTIRTTAACRRHVPVSATAVAADTGSPREIAEPLVLMIAPFTPHIAEELWARLGHVESLAYAAFPTADPALITAEQLEYPVQVNGKVRAPLQLPARPPNLAGSRSNEWAETWLASKKTLKGRTYMSYESVWRTLVKPPWGDTRLDRVTHGEVVRWVAELTERGLSPSRITQALLCLKQVLALAVMDGRLARNAAEHVKPPRPRKAEPRFLTHEQVHDLAEACGRYRVFVLTAAYTGLRWGELRALRAKRIDLERGRIDVAEAMPERSLELDIPKNHKRRTVPIPGFVVDELEKHAQGKGPDDLVFTNSAGGMLDNTNFRRNIWNPAARSIGLDGFTPHDLRHTTASLAVSAGANVKALQRLLGHASASMTLDVYSALFDSDLDAVAERLGQRR
jgi:integrase